MPKRSREPMKVIAKLPDQWPKIQADQANENGDLEQLHYRFKQAADQALMMQGSCDFPEVAAYQMFLVKLFSRLNAGRPERYLDEVARLRPLPEQQLDSARGNGSESVHAVRSAAR
jgi:hypothetical protein